VNLRSLLMSPAPGCPALRRGWPTGGGIVAEVVGAAGEADRPAGLPFANCGRSEPRIYPARDGAQESPGLRSGRAARQLCDCSSGRREAADAGPPTFPDHAER
jgi:hypothetical protein